MPKTGLEPARLLRLGILSPLCLPFHHSGLNLSNQLIPFNLGRILMPMIITTIINYMHQVNKLILLIYRNIPHDDSKRRSLGQIILAFNNPKTHEPDQYHALGNTFVPCILPTLYYNALYLFMASCSKILLRAFGGKKIWKKFCKKNLEKNFRKAGLYGAHKF